MKKIRTVVIDDSIFMRKAIENMLAGESDIEVVGFGANGEDAVKLAKELKPDVMTLDIEMPKMNGIDALGIIMREAPLPVIMVSSLTQENAETTLKALDLGAVDFIPKEKSFGSIGVLKISNELKSKIRRFATDTSLMQRLHLNRLKASLNKTNNAKKLQVTSSAHKSVVVLGTSTGGPQSLQKVIPLLPADLGVPVLVVQHMPPNFTHSLANRLNSMSKVTVLEAQGGEKIQPNHVYIAKGGCQMTVKNGIGGHTIEISPEIPSLLHNPSVDVMVSSAVKAYSKNILGVIMTGMGNDGTKGLTEAKSKGAFIISQDEPSCIVYGMPKAVYDAGIADEVVPLEDIASRIIFHCRS